MILKKLIFLFFNHQVHVDIPLPTSSPPKKPTKPTLKVPTLFLFFFFRQNRECFGSFCWDLRLDLPFWTPWGDMNLPHQVVPSYLRWNALVRRRLESSTPWPVWGRKKNGRMPWKDRKVLFWRFSGKKREGRFSEFFGIFFHLYMTTLFLLGTLLFFSVASAGNLFFFCFSSPGCSGCNYAVSLSVPQHHLRFSVPWL